MARFLLSALTAITLILSAEITKTSALGSQRQPLIQSEQNLQTLLLEESSESGQRPAIREKRVALIIGCCKWLMRPPEYSSLTPRRQAARQAITNPVRTACILRNY